VDRHWLLIETSGREGIVGLGLGTNVVAERRLDRARRHAQDLGPAIADALKSVAWPASTIDAVAVGLGPGSYTGLRVGVMAAQAFAYARKCSLVGVPTFETIARGCSLACSEVDVIGDALKGRLYVQRFRRGPGAAELAPAGELTILLQSEWMAKLTPGTGISGPGLNVVEASLPDGVVRAADHEREPSLRSLLSLAAASRIAGRSEPRALEPIYLQASSAEQQWDQRG
jgi:tRNA threonylcarbamoyladenosine biosynthesis protein TsaB